MADGALLMTQLRRRWVPRAWSRVGLTLVALPMVAIALVMGVVDGDWVLSLFPVAAAAVMLLGAFATSVELQAGHLIVRNLGLRTSMPLVRVKQMEATYWGIRLEGPDGVAIIAMAVQKSNLSTYSGRTSRADRVIQELRRLQAAVG